MPRPRKAARVRRIELRLAEDDPLLVELAQEAELRRVELTQHIADLLRSRYLMRRGQSFSELLWVPGSATVEVSAPKPGAELNQLSNLSATAAAAAWTDLLDTEDQS